MSGAFDAWFLDGFAPARNAALWSDAIFRADGAALKARRARSDLHGGGRCSAGARRRRASRSRRSRALARSASVWRRACGPRAAPAAPIYPYGGCNPEARGRAGRRHRRGGVRRSAGAARCRDRSCLEAARDLGAGASGNPAGLVMPRLDRGGPLTRSFSGGISRCGRALRGARRVHRAAASSSAPSREAKRRWRICSLIRLCREDWFAAHCPTARRCIRAQGLVRATSGDRSDAGKTRR